MYDDSARFHGRCDALVRMRHSRSGNARARCGDRPEFEDAILGSATGTHYILRPINGGAQTIFTGIGIADPKGSIPKWLVNWVGGSWPHETIQALRRQVRKDDVFVMPRIEPFYTGFEIQPPHQLISADPPASK
jgi:hypothetical protein